jgi:hypothetical protein
MPPLATDDFPPLLDAAALAGLLAEGDRRRVFAAMVLGARTLADIERATGLDGRAAGTALARLSEGGLVVRDKSDHYLVEDAFRLAARAAAAATPASDSGVEGVEGEPARVLRAFVRDGRLVSMPAQHGKRMVVLDLLSQQFEPGRRYREPEVNAILLRWHDDCASLRRYLVDEGFLERDAGEYWRAGGTFEA